MAETQGTLDITTEYIWSQISTSYSRWGFKSWLFLMPKIFIAMPHEREVSEASWVSWKYSNIVQLCLIKMQLYHSFLNKCIGYLLMYPNTFFTDGHCKSRSELTEMIQNSQNTSDSVLGIWPLIFGNVCPWFQSQSGSLTCVVPCLHIMDTPDSPLVQHLLTSWWPTWHPVTFPTCI